jgi:hypothetical protein
MSISDDLTFPATNRELGRDAGGCIIGPMTAKTEFAAFVEHTLQAVIQFAEDYTGTILPRKLKFRWLDQDAVVDEEIVEAIVNRVYVDPENIYPCVDIGVGDLAHDGSPIIFANVAGYSPKPFQKNWTGREGPFVFIIGQPYLDKLAGNDSPSNRAFSFITPEMKNLKS